MDCQKILSCLNAYQDGELSSELAREVEAHLKACQACRNQAENMQWVGDILDTLAVPPLPHGFAARVMAEAQRRTSLVKERKPVSTLSWLPRWFAGLSAPMRLAACVTVLAACLLGLFMGKEVSSSANLQSAMVQTESLDGFEWFDPAPPASLGSAYLNLALTLPEERGAQ